MSEKEASKQHIFNNGSSAYKGYGIGRIHVFGGKDNILNAHPEDPENKDDYLKKILKRVHDKFESALVKVKKSGSAPGSSEYDMLNACIMGTKDFDQFKSFLTTVAPNFEKQTLHQSLREIYKSFNTSMEEVGAEIMLNLMSEHSGVAYEDVDSVKPGSVLVSGAVGMCAAIDLIERKVLSGVISSESDAFHFLILCKEHGIPSITESQVPEIVMESPSEYQGKKVIVDSSKDTGKIFINPQREILASYNKAQKEEKLRKEEQRKHAFEPCVTRDGTHVSIWGNKNNLDFIDTKELPIDGIGLLRLESVFAHHAARHELLDSGMLGEEFDDACRHLNTDRPVTVRLLDINGKDKKADELLYGYQKDMAITNDDDGGALLGTAFLLRNQGLFEMQIRSVISVHLHHPQRILLPYVNSENEIKQARKIVNEVYDVMRVDIPLLSAPPPIFSMVETEKLTRNPHELEKVIRASDGISIGGNDLSCELAGVDRYGASSKKDGFLPIYNPEFIQKLSEISKLSLKHGKEVSMCGDCASDLDFVPVLVALGIKPVVLGSAAYDVHDRIRSMNMAETQKMVDGLKDLKTSKGVHNRIRKFAEDNFSAPLSSVNISWDAE